MQLLYFIIFAIFPSFLWLIFFLKEDPRPEPKKTILKVFFYGVLSAIPVILIGVLINIAMRSIGLNDYIVTLVSIVFVAAITEEIAKYCALKHSALKSSECDEPPDIMIYAITAAMGFAAFENLLFLLPDKEVLLISPNIYLKTVFAESIIRFASGTFLHALTSGIIGYFVAISMMTTKHRKKIVIIGLFLAMLLHGLYNLSIIAGKENESLFVIAPTILIMLFIVIFYCFSKTRKMTSICKLEK